MVKFKHNDDACISEHLNFIKIAFKCIIEDFLDLWHSEFKNNTIFSFQDISDSTLKSQEAKLF